MKAPVEVWGGQTEPNGQVVDLDEVELFGTNDGAEREKAVEIEDEEVEMREAEFEFNNEDEDKDDKEDEEDGEIDEYMRASTSCCGDDASKVSLLGTEQSKLPEP